MYGAPYALRLSSVSVWERNDSQQVVKSDHEKWSQINQEMAWLHSHIETVRMCSLYSIIGEDSEYQTCHQKVRNWNTD